MPMSEAETLLKTVLHPAHVAFAARMTPFGGYDMPVQYPEGVLAEHRWTRAHAGLFDVSHMGPCFLTLDTKTGDPEADHAAVSALIEPLISGDIAGLKPGQLRYTVLLNETGGMIDDLMVGRPLRPEHQGMLYVVVNAGTKDNDFALIAAAAAGKATLSRADDRALVALQGPDAEAVLATLFPEAADLSFMTFRRFERNGEGFVISRSGYSGEDGYEILIPTAQAREVWDLLLADDRVRPVGLGARDSLRLEAGLPLYGHDADETVSPIEAGLAFAVAKKRRARGDLRGAERLARELEEGPARVRIGLRVLSGAPAREGAEIADASGAVIGRVTSGGPSPSLGHPIAMGFVPPAFAAVGTSLQVIVRGRAQPAEVVALPFVPHRYVRKA
jgi:aminomethyltransferase